MTVDTLRNLKLKLYSQLLLGPSNEYRAPKSPDRVFSPRVPFLSQNGSPIFTSSNLEIVIFDKCCLMPFKLSAVRQSGI